MKKLIPFLMLLPLLFTGCRLACNAEKVVADKLAGAIAMAASCSHQDAIQVDVLAAIDIAKLCAAGKLHDERCADFHVKQGPVANVVCPFVTAALVSIAGNALPVRYGCQLSGSPLSAVVLQACLTLPL